MSDISSQLNGIKAFQDSVNALGMGNSTAAPDIEVPVSSNRTGMTQEQALRLENDRLVSQLAELASYADNTIHILTSYVNGVGTGQFDGSYTSQAYREAHEIIRQYQVFRMPKNAFGMKK